MDRYQVIAAGLILVALVASVGMPMPGYAQGRQPPQRFASMAADSAAEEDRDVSYIPSEQRGAYYVWYGNQVRASEGRRAIRWAVAELGGQVTFEFDPALVPAVSVLLPEAAVSQLKAQSAVVFIEPVPEYQLFGDGPVMDVPVSEQRAPAAPTADPQVVPWNVDQVQARDVWDVDRDGVVDPGAPDGSGVKFCIIDTGFYVAHSDHQGVVASGISQITGEDWWQDGNGHGTHVAGTANAQNNDIGVVGVMPGGAELFIVKIFDNTGNWVVGQSNLGAAAELCRDAGANAISMSLGGGYSATENNIFQGLYDNDNIVNIAAAGNDGNTVLSYPASYDSVISVAALTEDARWATFSQYPPTAYDPNNPPVNVEWDAVELAAGGQGVLSTLPFPDGDVPLYQLTDTGSSVIYSGGHIDESGTGNPIGTMVDGGLCDSVGAWTGQIVLCERGTISFAEKVNNVRDGGGVGAVIYNNEPGNFAGTCGGACTTPLIPALSLSQEHGQYLVNNRMGQIGDLLVDDGTGCVDCVGGYDYWDGTSMATPAVAAGVAWVWDSCGGPAGITNKQLRQLLRDSAMDLTLDGGVGWDAKTGWGLIQLRDALDLGHQRFGSTCPLTLLVQPPTRDVCTLSANSTTFDVTLNDSFVGTVDMTVSGYPAGTTPVFSPNPVISPDNATVLTLSGLDNAASGSYVLTIQGTNSDDPDDYATGDPTLNLSTALPGSPTLLGLADGQTGAATLPTFSWQTVAGEDYTLQIATDPDFTQNLREIAGVTSPHTLEAPALDSDTVYYWRVRATNSCGSAESTIWAFRTAPQPPCSELLFEPGFENGPNSAWSEDSAQGYLVVTGDYPRTGAYSAWLGGISNETAQVWQSVNIDPAATSVTLNYWYEIQSTDNSCVSTERAEVQIDGAVQRTTQMCILNETNGWVEAAPLDLSSYSGLTELRFWAVTDSETGPPGSRPFSSFFVDDVSIQQCFDVIPVTADYSDLDSEYGVAWHTGDGSLRLGSNWTADISFSPGSDDSDDGVSFPDGFAAGTTVDVQVNVQGTPTNGRWLRVWFDWNGDGTFGDAGDGELVYDAAALDGDNVISVAVPSDLSTSVNYRVRLYDSVAAPAGLRARDGGSYGEATGGEVEDGGTPSPTAVLFAGFEAQADAEGILVIWETGNELDLVGFNLYRSQAAGGPYTRLNDEVIFAQYPGMPLGARYAWRDARVQPGVTYFYVVEGWDIYGERLFAGPAWATARWQVYLPLMLRR